MKNKDRLYIKHRDTDSGLNLIGENLRKENEARKDDGESFSDF